MLNPCGVTVFIDNDRLSAALIGGHGETVHVAVEGN